VLPALFLGPSAKPRTSHGGADPVAGSVSAHGVTGCDECRPDDAEDSSDLLFLGSCL